MEVNPASRSRSSWRSAAEWTFRGCSSHGSSGASAGGAGTVPGRGASLMARRGGLGSGQARRSSSTIRTRALIEALGSLARDYRRLPNVDGLAWDDPLADPEGDRRHVARGGAGHVQASGRAKGHRQVGPPEGTVSSRGPIRHALARWGHEGVYQRIRDRGYSGPTASCARTNAPHRTRCERSNAAS